MDINYVAQYIVNTLKPGGNVLVISVYVNT